MKWLVTALGLACVALWIATVWCELNTVEICPICCCHGMEPPGCTYIRLWTGVATIIFISVLVACIEHRYILAESAEKGGG